MAKIDTTLSKKRGERVKLLLKEKNMRQSDLAELMNFTPEHLSAMLNGKRNITQETAKSIAKIFSPVRHEWILCEDDFKTEEDKFEFALDKMESDAKVIHAVIKAIAESHKYEIRFLDASIENIENVELVDSCYAIVENGLVIACISLEEYSRLRSEIAHYSSYLFGNLLSKSKTRMLKPFNYPEKETLDG